VNNLSQKIKKPTITSVIASLGAGGIGPVCRYAAQGVAKQTGWDVTLLSLHDPPSESVDEVSGLRTVCLGLQGNCARQFLEWLKLNPQDLIITSDVCYIEPAFPFVPASTLHVVQIHDSGRRYRAVAVRNASWINGVTCVGKHIEAPLRRELEGVGYQGVLRTVHNGASFPEQQDRKIKDGPIRLLFMGRVESFKGVFDFVPLLQRLKRSNVPATLNIVGGDNEMLRYQFEAKGVSDMVTWTGRVPHEQCYDLAAASDIFLMTSRKEPFGMVTIEAMSMGCVPIAYDIPSGSTEIIDHNKNGLLVPLGNIRIMADEIIRLHADRHLLGELSSAASIRARTVFNSEVMSRNITSFLKDVIDHADSATSIREIGDAPEMPIMNVQAPEGYQRLSPKLREWIRNQVGARPRLCHWWLNR
jgi:glycosyltransferase involved in cell wall biosynthesis